ncbi:MAG: pantoate--beta-alanine ligase [Deltaproteobacteria bacterium]|nr:pantoate--beta-alanine ligase [Deltaproteobacteria bacterium]MBW2178894.1 pantoate--beta-alanine ligase [Deltaproteobacteria bacterium]MBW2364629.1 pantoate--beta-alanine ligase [Deltaproteobacteria bacterium]
MHTIATTNEMQAYANRLISRKKSIAFVPTMGFLHEGHLSLMREGRKRGDVLVVSIFVNPTQFGEGEDFDSYPKDLERDLELARKENVDVVFTPDKVSLYENGFQTYVNLEKLPKHLCGISRPIFFQGVATVVTKLFNIVKPSVAIFGQKDYQQLAVIKRMVRDLNFDIEIVGAPTVREPDGLAMSSRNNYLKPEERLAALSLFESLSKAQNLCAEGVLDSDRIINEVKKLIHSHKDSKIDYISICDPDTLEDIKTIESPVVMALAVKVGKTRLIDNMIINY